MVLSSAELDALSTALAFARPDSCVRHRLVNTRGAGGGVKATRAAQPAVSCRVEAGRRLGTEGIVGGAITPVLDYTIALPRGTTVLESDEIEHTQSGQRFQVIAENSAATFHAEVEVQARTVQ